MTATTKWIEDMQTGEFVWNGKRIVCVELNEYTNTVALWSRYENGGGDYTGVPLEALLIHPPAWQAVGRTRGWLETGALNSAEWKARMIGFMGLLASGLSIEDALKAIE